MEKSTVKKKLGEILISMGKLNEEKLQKALERQKVTHAKLGEILIEMELITEKEMIHTLAIQYHYPFIQIENYQFTKEVLALIPKCLAIQLQCLPMDKIGDFVSFVLADPATVIELSQQEIFSKYKMNFFVTMPSTLKLAIKKCYGE
jgi:type IV pilus assembly protein PilB